MTAHSRTGACPAAVLHAGPGVHRRLAALRGQGPLVRVLLHGRTPAWLLTRATDVEQALADPRLSSDARWLSPGHGDSSAVSSVKLSLMGRDGTEHRHLRRILARPFSSRSLYAFPPRVQALTDHLVDHIEESGSGDLVEDLALPLSLHVICDLLGIPPDHRAHTHELTRSVLAPDTTPQPHALRRHLDTYLHTPLSTALDLHRTDRDPELTRDEITEAGMLLLVAGYETTAALIGSVLLRLLETPDHYQRLVHDPEQIPAAIDELTRLEGPVALGVTRYTTTALPLAGTDVPAGSRILVSLGAADRDPKRWLEPDRPDFTRPPQRNLAFGYGPHYCLGARLARIEALTAIATLTRRLPRLALTDPSDVPPLAGLFHGPRHVHVTTQLSP